MSDNNLRISFDYKYPYEAALVVCNVSGGSSYFGSPELHIKKVITGEEAVELYSRLTGKSVEYIRKDAGYTNES